MKNQLKQIKGITIGLGEADPHVEISAKLDAQYPSHLILVQSGNWLHGFNKTAYVLHTLKQYKLTLAGPAKLPHLRIGFPLSNFKQRLWPMVDEFNMPYVVATTDKEVYVCDSLTNNNALDAVSDDIVAEVIEQLRTDKQLKTASTAKILTNPKVDEFIFKTKAIELDTQLLQDLIKLPRDMRVTWGENVRQTTQRIMRNTYLYGNEDNKPQLLKKLSADVDLLKHYITQAQRLNRFKIAFEHRVGLAVELGSILGGMIRAQRVPS